MPLLTQFPLLRIAFPPDLARISPPLSCLSWPSPLPSRSDSSFLGLCGMLCSCRYHGTCCIALWGGLSRSRRGRALNSRTRTSIEILKNCDQMMIECSPPQRRCKAVLFGHKILTVKVKCGATHTPFLGCSKV